jgi:diketogulonate reductase-like aldo/keto reductase
MPARSAIRKVMLPSGEVIPAIGQGTWHMAEIAHRHSEEIAALRLGLDLGMALIDTSEMYGDGAAEQLVAEAIGERRGDAFLVSKVLPDHATRRGTIAACERRLTRLRTDRIDLYLLRWRGNIPLEQAWKPSSSWLARVSSGPEASAISMFRAWRNSSASRADRPSQPSRCSTT